MTAIHMYECDSCHVKVHAKFNGEHWLAPKDWIDLRDHHLVQIVGQICDRCRTVLASSNIRATKEGRKVEKIVYGKN